ncbi:MAG: FtsQ-type POTRA domain-containing protein [Acidobacteriota bacterium]
MKKKTYNAQTVVKQLALMVGRVALLGLLVLVGTWVLDHSWHSTEVVELFTLEEIRYQGLTQLNRDELDLLIYPSVSSDLLVMDLDRVRALVESESWVKEATVRRKLPDGLFIHVTEREAVAVAAIDTELYVVDQEGVILDRPSSQHLSLDRPIVKGLKSEARENAREENAARMGTYLKVLMELTLYNPSISEIDVSTPRSVAVIPEGDPVPVYLGDKDFLARYETFISQRDLYDRLKAEYGIIESVDVTYDNKIIFHTPRGKEETVTTPADDRS